MLIWWMSCYILMSERDNKGKWEACEAVEGGGTCTALLAQYTPVGDLNEQLQDEKNK